MLFSCFSLCRVEVCNVNWSVVHENSHCSALVFSSTDLPKQLADYQKRDPQLVHVYECVANQSKPKLSAIYRVKSRPVRRLLLQYDRLSLI